MRRRMIVRPLVLLLVFQALPVVAGGPYTWPSRPATTAPPPDVPDVSGVWAFDFGKERSSHALPLPAPPMSPSDCTFEQEGKHVTGRCGSDAVPIMGVVNGQRVTFRIGSGDTDRRSAVATLTAVLSPQATTMKGRWYVQNGGGTFNSTRLR